MLLCFKPHAKQTHFFLLLCGYEQEHNSQGQMHPSKNILQILLWSTSSKRLCSVFRGFQCALVLKGFQKKMSAVCVSWKKSRNILLPEMMQSHHQIKPNAIKLLLSTGLSSCIIAVLSFNQSCVSAKIPFECFNSQKPVEN